MHVGGHDLTSDCVHIVVASLPPHDAHVHRIGLRDAVDHVDPRRSSVEERALASIRRPHSLAERVIDDRRQDRVLAEHRDAERRNRKPVHERKRAVERIAEDAILGAVHLAIAFLRDHVDVGVVAAKCVEDELVDLGVGLGDGSPVGLPNRGCAHTELLSHDLTGRQGERSAQPA